MSTEAESSTLPLPFPAINACSLPAEIGTKAFQERGQRIKHHFMRPEPYDQALNYVRGLMSDIARKKGWQVAEEVGEATPYAMQHLLDRAGGMVMVCEINCRRLSRRRLLARARIGDRRDRISQKGARISGSATPVQWHGWPHRKLPGGSLSSSSSRGHASLDREWYLPKSWADDPERCQEAHVPAEVTFATKPERRSVCWNEPSIQVSLSPG